MLKEGKNVCLGLRKEGKIKNLTGFDGVYEKGYESEIIINTEHSSLKESVEIVITYLKNKGLI